ncbi:MAG TPA: hypothetical protein VK966_11050, partial [Longimicrobiales bacterium]|nr:hypothetical protein [Longimicrobiales bacterium]
GKQMEGDNRQRRKKAREARERGNTPGEENVTTGASKQRERMKHDAGHREKIESIRQGKQEVISQNTPEPRPGYGEEDED